MKSQYYFATLHELCILAMKHLFYILTVSLLLLASCGEKPAKQANASKSVPQREGIQWGDFLFGSLDEFGETDEVTLLYTTADGTVDSLDFLLFYPMEPENFSEIGGGKIEEDDINFDGIPDVQICLGAFDAYWNITYEGFVWDKEKGAFVNVPNYYNIFNPWLDESDNSITSNYREWLDGVQYRTYEKYEWVDGELTKTDEWADEYNLNEEEDAEDE